jgi:hypothetical protein
MSLVTAAMLYSSRSRRHSCSMSAVFPEPTGPPSLDYGHLAQGVGAWAVEDLVRVPVLGGVEAWSIVLVARKAIVGVGHGDGCRGYRE